MLAAPAALLIFLFLPLKYEKGNHKDKVRKIDYGGIILNLAAVLLILIPLSGGGVQYSWNSPMVIAMLTVGGCTAIAFVLYEWKLAKVPIMPVRLVKYPYCWSLYVQNFFTGMCFFGNFFYLPIYFQSVLGLSALISGALLLPLIMATSFTGIVSGQIMSRSGRYLWIIVSGFAVWTLGAGLKCAFNRKTKIWHIVLVLLVEGMGIGNILQSTLVAILANGSNSDRAVATGLRNFIRTIGGAFGLIISGAILANTLDSRLSHLPFMTKDILQNLTSSTFSLTKLGFSTEEMDLVLDSYIVGIRYIYIMYAASAGVNLVLCAWIGNTDLKAKAPVVVKIESSEKPASNSLREVQEAPEKGKGNKV
jgi:MFS family permease